MKTSRQFDLQVDGSKIAAGVCEPKDRKAVVVLCHGIPSGHPYGKDDTGYPGLAQVFAARGYEAWWFSFRGCYGSEGFFSMGAWISDLHAIILEAAVDGVPLYLVGSSAGGAVSLIVATETTKVSGVATLAAPAYWRLDADHLDGGLLAHSQRTGLLPEGFPRDQAEQDAWLAEFDTNRPEWAVALMGGRPLLIVHGTEDATVPVSDAHRLYENAYHPKMLALVEGAGHQLRLSDEAVSTVLDWLDDVIHIKHFAQERAEENG